MATCGEVLLQPVVLHLVVAEGTPGAAALLEAARVNAPRLLQRDGALQWIEPLRLTLFVTKPLLGVRLSCEGRVVLSTSNLLAAVPGVLWSS